MICMVNNSIGVAGLHPCPSGHCLVTSYTLELLCGMSKAAFRTNKEQAK